MYSELYLKKQHGESLWTPDHLIHMYIFSLIDETQGLKHAIIQDVCILYHYKLPSLLLKGPNLFPHDNAPYTK